MGFLQNFEEICRKRGESPSHALESAGLSRAAYGKWKKNPDRTPTGKTIELLMNYFGCSYDQLVGRRTDSTRQSEYTRFINQCAHMNDHDFHILLSFAQFTWPDIFQ